MKLPITQWKQLRYSDERIALECAKEYLLKEMDKIRSEIKIAESSKINLYMRSIVIIKLKERIEFLNSLSNDVQYEIKQLPKSE